MKLQQEREQNRKKKKHESARIHERPNKHGRQLPAEEKENSDNNR